MERKRELEYFNIGNSYGGNQRWMMDPWMHIGGCAALTTCDILIYLALHKGKPELCPYPADKITKKQYRRFAMSVRSYLQPRESGIKDIRTYMEGTAAYLEDIGETGIKLAGMSGSEEYEKAEAALMEQIDNGMPAAYLMLKHHDSRFDFFDWHWFPVIGYEAGDSGVYIKAATYGRAHWLPLAELWDTGFDEKGGIVTFEEV